MVLKRFKMLNRVIDSMKIIRLANNKTTNLTVIEHSFFLKNASPSEDPYDSKCTYFTRVQNSILIFDTKG